MAHELEIVDGKAQMAYAGETPWHSLGNYVGDNLTPEEMQKAANLNWEVVQVPLVAEYNGKKIDTGRTALIRDRDSKVLTVTSDDWNPVQNRQAFEFFNDFVEAGNMQMHTAGSLKGGNIVWALAKLNKDFTVFGGDRVEGYLLFSNPHIYGRAVDVRFTPIRVVCNNTLTFALNGKSDMMVRVDHRSEFDEQLVKKALGLADQKLNAYKEAAEFLGKTRYDEKTLDAYLAEVFPAHGKKGERNELSRPALTAKALVDTQPGADFAPGSWWNALNAVTFTTDHVLGRSDDTRLTSAWYGVNRQKKLKALEKAVDYANEAA